MLEWPHFVVGQEIIHCMGQVRNESPNSTGASHSVNQVIPTYSDFLLVNMLWQIDQTDPLSQMYGFFKIPHDNDKVFLEGWEWNDLRNNFRSWPSGPIRIAGAEPLFHVVGTMDPLTRWRLSTRSESTACRWT